MSDSNHNSEKIKVLNTPISPVLFDISQLLNTQLDKETLATCVSLIESGVNPEALAVSRDWNDLNAARLMLCLDLEAVIQELRRENIALKANGKTSPNGR